MIAGKDKGKTAKVLKAMPKENKIIVEGVNMRKKHQRAKTKDGKGQVIEFAVPVHVSNVMLSVDGKGVRVGSQKVGEKKVRLNKKTGKAI